jgi:transcriptional coactivator HFI1/ADA1
VESGELARGVAGELPAESEERRKRKLLCMEDLRLALYLGDGYLGQTPFIAGHVMESRCLDTEGVEALYDSPSSHPPMMVNGNGNAKGSGLGEQWTVDFHLPDPMQIDGEETWMGGSVKDVGELDGVLDDILHLGDL